MWLKNLVGEKKYSDVMHRAVDIHGLANQWMISMHAKECEGVTPRLLKKAHTKRNERKGIG